MRKSIVICGSILVALLIGLAIFLVVFFTSNKNIKVKDGLVIAEVQNLEILNEALATDGKAIELRLDKADNTINNVTINDSKGRDELVIKGGRKSFENLQIVTNAAKIILSDLTVTHSEGNIGIQLNNILAELQLNNVIIKMESYSGCAVAFAAGGILVIDNSANLEGGRGLSMCDGGAAVKANDLTIKGSGSLYLTGGQAGEGINGANGVNGTSYSPERKSNFGPGSAGRNGGDGDDGGTGKEAGKGGDALICDILTVKMGVNLICQGGAGAQGGNGGQGGDGGSGEGATRPQPFQKNTYEGGCGGNGGQGGSGAAEQRSGYGIVCKRATIEEGALVAAKAGSRGARGLGGQGGKGGVGGQSSGGSIENWSGEDDAPSGQTGEKGADGESLAESMDDFLIGELVGTIN